MSTEERYSNAIYRGIIRNRWTHLETRGHLMTVGEVARWGGVSGPTAQKYLMRFVKVGIVCTFPVGKRWVYQYVGDGRDI